VLFQVLVAAPEAEVPPVQAVVLEAPSLALMPETRPTPGRPNHRSWHRSIRLAGAARLHIIITTISRRSSITAFPKIPETPTQVDPVLELAWLTQWANMAVEVELED